jgi:hypothetical protein
MIFIKSIEYDNVVKQLDKENDIITIMGCETCARVAGVSNEEQLKKLAGKLIEDGYNVEGGYLIPSLCTPKVLFTKVKDRVNTIISISCNAGASNLIRIFADKKIISATEDIGLMIENTDKHIVKITVPYGGHDNEYGKEYQANTGIKMDTDDNLSFGRIDK